MAASSREALLLQLYHHTVLPRDVPGCENKNLHQAESELAERLMNAVKLLALHAPLSDHSCLDAIRLALSTCKSLHVDGKIDRNLLAKELRQLNAKQALILHVTEQNAALLVYQQFSNDGTKMVVFEAFETSATCEKVLATESALKWDFPGQAVAVLYDTFSSDDFQHSLSVFLEQASLESIKQFAAITYKACAPQPEIRDTPDPTLITGALMALLEVNGAVYDTPRLRKRVRDTVSFNKAHKPWRRSAFYLVLRVATQRHLYTLLGPEKGRLYYKAIMCILLSKLLNDGLCFISNEASHCLRQKLGRRLAKLEIDHDRGSMEVKGLHSHIFRTLGPDMDRTLSSAARLIESQWDAHKRRTSRIIRPIQHLASHSDMTLRLMLSGRTLSRAMQLRFSTMQNDICSPVELLGRYESNTTTKPYHAVMNRYLTLSACEEEMSKASRFTDRRSKTDLCVQLAHNIKEYLFTVQDAYKDYPEFKGRQLLRTMELWMALDEHATNCYPLLSEYHPCFEASMLDVLELSTLEEFTRLHTVQSYIAKRCQAWCGQGSKTIFDTPVVGSYAVRYYDKISDTMELQELRQRIEKDADALLAAKEVEWKRKSQQHESKIRAMAGLSCVYVSEQDEHGFTRQVHKKGCLKHKLKWEAKQITIDIFEYPLPEAEPALKAIIFELMCPEGFAAYRDATWLIFSSFGYPRKPIVDDVPLLRAYAGLNGYANTTNLKVTLGSFTKSHMKSHYSTTGFPNTFRDVCRSFGLRLDYYDTVGKTWTAMDEQPTFAHLFPLKLPLGSPYESFKNISDKWPTSNRVLATQTTCPADLNIHEYMAWQGLMTGTYLRWPCLLREMGSTNLSFSTDSTWAIVTRLLFQVGPDSSHDILRDAHAVFHDPNFCNKLLDQVDYRLEAIRRNWRESVQLDILLSILFQVATLSSSRRVHARTESLFVEARSISQGWCANIQSTDREMGPGPSVFMIWATVLCKRTFYSSFNTTAIISPQSLKEFIIASIALQNCLVGQFDHLPFNLRNAVLRDLTLTYGFRDRLCSALSRDKGPIMEALQVFWPVPADCLGSPFTSSLDRDSWWVTITLSTRYGLQHYIHYNFVQGTLLINGQEMGMLPPEYRRWPIIKELFGSQTLQIFPSPLPGMSLVINRPMPFDHWVHLGFRDNSLVIRAERHGDVLELIQRSLFGSERQYDLPASLAMDCYHWLDLGSGILEIRQQNPWKPKKSNWSLNLYTRQATRNNGSSLVDPSSELAIKVAQNFYQFEYAHYITVYQTPHGNLRVELKRLELEFVVLHSGLLLCPQLDAVIAESRLQDVGTWYGLKSKLVVRSMKDPIRRSILLPLGEAIYEREGPHVSVVIKNAGSYLKFDVNQILGRIECPTEPLMLYHRALWHASTSYFLPDPLTNRTGGEEALQYLRSGAYRPWTPLSISACNVLVSIAELSPQRVYYPTTMKVMESVQWNPKITICMQDDQYRRTIDDTLKKNKELTQYAPTSSGPESLPGVSGNIHLENRALSRGTASSSKHDQEYESRDCRMQKLAQANVAAISGLIAEWPSLIVETSHLPLLLEQMPVIGGYVRCFDKIQITDILDAGEHLGADWGALVNTVMECSKKDKFHLMFLASMLAFSPVANMDLLRTIISFVLISDLKKLIFPKAASYSHFHFNEPIEIDMLMNLMDTAKRPYKAEHNTPIGQRQMRQSDHEKKASKAVKILAESIRAQWPSKELDFERLASVSNALLDRDEALLHVLPEWNRLVDNFHFSQHIEEVQLVLRRNATRTKVPKAGPLISHHVRSHEYPSRVRGGDLPRLQDILGKDLSALALSIPNQKYGQVVSSILTKQPNGLLPAVQPVHSIQSPTGELRKQPQLSSHIKELCEMIAPYEHSSSMIHRRYGAELKYSIEALSDRLDDPSIPQGPLNLTELSGALSEANKTIILCLDRIRSALRAKDTRARWLDSVGLWPKVTQLTLLTELRSTSETNFGPGVKEALVNLGLAITTYQRLLRIQDAIQKQRRQQVLDERKNVGHTNWSPLERADWLLLEVESNIMLRPEQVDVALATISPHSGQNSVVQLLMGKGKTSCILPMVALALANESLVRIVVPRPLLLQSAQIMQAKLGGLLNREVLHIPFSRKTPTDKALMRTYCQLHSNIQKHSGILLALPEHILSFKLSGLQRLCDGRVEEASVMIKAQAWLNRHARDVLDECDVSLAIRTQLIYPSGSQQTVDGHPHRWQTIQALLDLIVTYLEDLMRQFPHSIEVVRRTGFPLIYFLRKDVEEYLITQLVQKISKGQTAILPVRELPVLSQQDLSSFISVPLVSAERTGRILEMFKNKRHLMDIVYHLRGLFVHRILLSTLKKRWNVQYGLHPTRNPIAVPYQAKGVPSPTAEWGHPDVAITLTCLSFYYEGLSMAQFKQAFEQLAKSDEPSIVYGLWVAEGVPEGLRNYNAINVEDSQQLRELHHYIRYKVCLLDFYLNSFVFPRHAKQFSQKLSASGSDLILYEPMRPRCQTTGFSGTNDTRHQLPVTIRQSDLPQLAHTNAEVLVYLLEDRNRKYVHMVDNHNKRLSEDGLLKKLAYAGPRGESRIRILIDAGAQILEYDNRSLAKAWLKTDHEASAAVYFDEDHRPRILYGKGTDIPLVASPFAENLEKCLVYIDESHCRGTDLKLPLDARAAVTLGPHLTKDALVQAAMRMRLLGKTQSVVFFSPPEVHQCILDLRAAAKIRTIASLSSLDVIRWQLEQTCNGIEQLEPLYFNQGINYLQHVQAKLDYPDFLENDESRKAYLSIARSKELQSLKQLYEPKYHHRGASVKVSTFAPPLQAYVSEMLERRKCFQDRGLAVHSSALEEIEQEREMEFEVESVREVQQPIYFKALRVVSLHPDIKKFATTGTMKVGSDAFQPMFDALQKTALGQKHGTIKASRSFAALYTSTQFNRTVNTKEPNDNFLRPCHWLLWSGIEEIGLLVSPEEANNLIPILRNRDLYKPICHLITYAAPTTSHMLQFNDLNYFAIPPLPVSFVAPTWLKVELGIFAGRLYFEWDEYDELMSYLETPVPKDNEKQNTQIVLNQAFAMKPLIFLHEWLAIQRKGQDFEHTPMGYITTGKPLSAKHPFFSYSEEKSESKERVQSAAPKVAPIEEADDEESDDGEDNTEEHFFQHEDGYEDEIFYDADEGFDTKENTFFDGGAYMHIEEEPNKSST